MSPLSEPDVTWNQLWEGISLLLDELDFTGRSSTKFDELAEWVAVHLGQASDTVVCKYVQHPKNRWNRLREALRRHPTTIVLFFDGDDSNETLGRVCEAATVCPELQHVVVMLRGDEGAWKLASVYVRSDVVLPAVLADTPFPAVRFCPDRGVSETGRPSELRPEERVELARAVHSLSSEIDADSSADRGRLSELLSAATGLPASRVSVKAIPSSKNLGNRLGEALARSPAILVVACPEMLESRVLDEVDRWGARDSLLLLLVLCGEHVDVVVHGAREARVDALRRILDGESEAGPEVQPTEPPAGEISAPWQEWSYDHWNRVLVEYAFDVSKNDAPVERLAATPEELAEVVGTSPDSAADVTRAFVASCIDQIPYGRTSFCGFCSDYQGGRVRSKNAWSVDSDSPPHFFGMLWLTCLVAYGYPESSGGFFDRLWGLTGKSDHIKCLPDLWRALRDWTARKQERGQAIRLLVLPPEDEFRSTIGFSHFLAFPHAQDRTRLASVLVDSELVGFEPPINPVLKALAQNRDRFSPLFREDLDNFVSKFIDGHLDVRESAFWRAVRQEALEPSSTGRRRRWNRTTILALFDDDGLLPLLGCAEDWSAPPGVAKLPLDNSIGGFEHYAQQEGAGLEGVIESMLRSQMMLGPGPRALVRQGVLIFQEDQSHEYFLVSGHEINGADVALVRDDLVEPFRAAFGGKAHPFRLPGWSEITGCAVRPLDELPAGLERVLQLERTMAPPSLRLVGGIAVAGGYLAFPGLLPKVRAPEATSVTLDVNGEKLCCDLVDDEWELPSHIVETSTTTVRLEARWEGARGGRCSERRVRFLPAPIFEAYKPLGSGHFFVESCRPGQLDIEGGAPIPLGVSTPDRERSYDLLEWEPSARYLGAGVGEMSASPRKGFDWLVIGPKKSPELLLFVGDPEAPTPPADRVSPNKGDRRHWKSALSPTKAVMVRDGCDAYRSAEEFPRVAEALSSYRSHRLSKHPENCAPTDLDTLAHEPPSRTASADRTRAFEDAVAALSARRSGLRYQTMQGLLCNLTGTKDHALHDELIRAWADSGAVDIVRHQSYSVTKIVARTPRFVAVRRGPDVEASLIGLTTRGLIARVRGHAEKVGLVLMEVRPGNPWQPPLLRVRGSIEKLDEIATDLCLEKTEWLDWRGGSEVPDHFDVSLEGQSLWRDTPPKGFTPKKTWSFDSSGFRHGVEDDQDGVVVQQWVHPELCSIYVVLVNGVPDLWTYIRNWALLHAYDVSGRAPFTLDPAGWVRAEGRTPVHLPLTLGRLCSIVGEGVPGPTAGRNGTVGGYCYPFGRRVTEVVKTVIPSGWLQQRED